MVLDFFKQKNKKQAEIPEDLDVPPAPPKKEELPEFPIPDEVPEFKEESIPVKKEVSPIEKFEKAVVKEQQEELNSRDLTLKKPIFVYLDSYREMINELGLIKTTLKESTDSLARVAQFKEDEDKEFNKWEGLLKDVQKKLIFADKTLFK